MKINQAIKIYSTTHVVRNRIERIKKITIYLGVNWAYDSVAICIIVRNETNKTWKQIAAENTKL